MTSRRSAVDQLRAARLRGQAPDGYVVIGDHEAQAWAERNRFFYVDPRDIGEDVLPFTGLFVLVRSRKLHAGFECIQRIALVADMVTVFDLDEGVSEHIVLKAAA